MKHVLSAAVLILPALATCPVQDPAPAGDRMVVHLDWEAGGAFGLGRFVATADILRAVRRENQTRRIAIHCVAIGMESELLKKLAAENGGRYVRR